MSKKRPARGRAPAKRPRGGRPRGNASAYSALTADEFEAAFGRSLRTAASQKRAAATLFRLVLTRAVDHRVAAIAEKALARTIERSEVDQEIARLRKLNRELKAALAARGAPPAHEFTEPGAADAAAPEG